MKKIPYGTSGINVPAVAVGCMRINGLDEKGADAFVDRAMELGAYFFDHADIYGGGSCETIFGKAVKNLGIDRDKMWLQSKCGIVPKKMFDFSKKHIIEAVEGSLKRLGTDHLDSLLLHRPDALVEPEEVAEAFDELEASGKVRFFGVSNQNPYQMELLKKYVKQPLMANQLQLSIMHTGMITEGICVNMNVEGAVGRTGSILDYCRLNDITIQPWSPFQYGFFKGVFLDNEEFPELNAVINEIAEKYSVSNTAIAMAWLLRHPAKMQPITGTMNLTRLEDCVKAADVVITREEWYAIYMAAGNILP